MAIKPDRYISLSPSKVREIAQIKDVSEVTVRSALNFKTNSTLAMLIRAWALNNGGAEYVKQETTKKVKVL
ncbi:MAG: hypothetical protein PHO36_15625 [Parabacteroides sp.]|nr:hypothetical protein [Parabacteroides sp.]